MKIELRYFPPLLIAAAAAVAIAGAPIAAADPAPSPGYFQGPDYVGSSSPGADPSVPLGTQFMQ
jgi:hypothetical protein